jgi:hypothetical protein
MGRDVAQPSHDHCTGRGWVVSSKPRPYFTPGKEPVPIVQEAGWAPGPVWTGAGKSRPHRDSIPGTSSPYSVAIPTEPPGPPTSLYHLKKTKKAVSIPFLRIQFCRNLPQIVVCSRFWMIFKSATKLSFEKYVSEYSYPSIFFVDMVATFIDLRIIFLYLKRK